MSRFTLFLFLFLFCKSLYAQNIIKSQLYDSILKLRELSVDGSKTINQRYKFAKTALEFSKDTGVDSIILKSNRIFSTLFLHDGKYEEFKNVNYHTLKLAKKINDSAEIALSNHNLGWYHFQSRIQNDSAYNYLNKALKIYEKLNRVKSQVDVLQNLSDILQVEKDYLGSEENAIKALKLLESLPKNETNLRTIWNLYNILGIVSLELNQYDESIEYHKKAQEIADESEYGELRSLYSQNNVAFVHKEKGDIYTALQLYENVLEKKELFDLEPTFYALVLDNVAFTRFLMGNKKYDDLERMFKKAYKISDSLRDPITKLATTIDMAKFYQAQNNIESALRYANETYQLAKQTNENNMLLESLMILAELNPDGEGKKYLNEHIRLSDSLLQHERGIRNKFARVQFETDQIEQENERIATQRFWLLIVSIVLLLTLFLLYIIITQRVKNKELQFEKEQQQINEEIYNLMLSQQDKLDEARANEKKRISQEIHDGMLGKLFGVRMNLDTLTLFLNKEKMAQGAMYIKDLKTIEEDLRKISHDLNTDFVESSGFMDIVETLIQNQMQAYQLTYEFFHSDDIDWEAVSNKCKIHIYRILQETMQNIHKHAKAKHIKIGFHLKNGVILLAISDDGKGFVPNKSRKGIGLKNINSRVAEINGTVALDSEIDKGTTITIKIPYNRL